MQSVPDHCAACGRGSDSLTVWDLPGNQDGHCLADEVFQQARKRRWLACPAFARLESTHSDQLNRIEVRDDLEFPQTLIWPVAGPAAAEALQACLLCAEQLAVAIANKQNLLW